MSICQCRQQGEMTNLILTFIYLFIRSPLSAIYSLKLTNVFCLCCPGVSREEKSVRAPHATAFQPITWNLATLHLFVGFKAQSVWHVTYDSLVKKIKIKTKMTCDLKINTHKPPKKFAVKPPLLWYKSAVFYYENHREKPEAKQELPSNESFLFLRSWTRASCTDMSTAYKNRWDSPLVCALMPGLGYYDCEMWF